MTITIAKVIIEAIQAIRKVLLLTVKHRIIHPQ